MSERISDKTVNAALEEMVFTDDDPESVLYDAWVEACYSESALTGIVEALREERAALQSEAQWTGEQLAGVRAERDALREELERMKADAKLNQRLYDLVRQMRAELHNEGLIDREEYARFASAKGGVQRLEDYDAIRARMESAEREAAALRDELAQVKAEREREYVRQKNVIRALQDELKKAKETP